MLTWRWFLQIMLMILAWCFCLWWWRETWRDYEVGGWVMRWWWWWWWWRKTMGRRLGGDEPRPQTATLASSRRVGEGQGGSSHYYPIIPHTHSSIRPSCPWYTVYLNISQDLFLSFTSKWVWRTKVFSRLRSKMLKTPQWNSWNWW